MIYHEKLVGWHLAALLTEYGYIMSNDGRWTELQLNTMKLNTAQLSKHVLLTALFVNIISSHQLSYIAIVPTNQPIFRITTKTNASKQKKINQMVFDGKLSISIPLPLTYDLLTSKCNQFIFVLNCT